MLAKSPAAIQNLVRSVPGYRDPTRIAQDCSECLSEQRNLNPKQENFVKNDGTESTLVCLDGTIPMVYSNTRYNCPVQIWLMHDYPTSPPTCYVKPTHDMAIKPRHVHVDGTGFIYHQYLTEWSARSSLKVLCNTLSQVFGEQPPVYARPNTGSPAASVRPAAKPKPMKPDAAVASQPPPRQPQQPAQPPAQTQPQQQQPQAQPFRPPDQPKRPSSQEVAQQPMSGGGGQGGMMNHRRSQEDIPRISDEERARLELVAMVSSKLQADYDRYTRSSQEEFDLYQAKQADLEDTRVCIDQAMTALQDEKSNLLAIMQQLDATQQEVTAVLDARSKEPLPDVERLVVASDPMAQQLLGAVAHVKAIEDVLYHLDQALYGGAMDTEEFLRLTLRLSREQFFAKELINRILARRRQLGVC